MNGQRHVMKPVDAMKLKGRVTIEIAIKPGVPTTPDQQRVTGTAIRPEWWPFAWPLVFEKVDVGAYMVHEPVTGAFLMRCYGHNLARATEKAAFLWDSRKGVMAGHAAWQIFCGWIGESK